TFLTAFLSFLAVGYLTKGTYHLVLDQGPIGAIDLHLRWQEQHYVFRHKNPFDVRDRWDEAQGSGGSIPRREPAIEPDLGRPRPGYPPWAYATGSALFWPASWTAARCYFATIDLFLLFLLGVLAYRVGRPGGSALARFSCAAVLAAFSIHSTLGTGQYG